MGGAVHTAGQAKREPDSRSRSAREERIQQDRTAVTLIAAELKRVGLHELKLPVLVERAESERAWSHRVDLEQSSIAARFTGADKRYSAEAIEKAKASLLADWERNNKDEAFAAGPKEKFYHQTFVKKFEELWADNDFRNSMERVHTRLVEDPKCFHAWARVYPDTPDRRYVEMVMLGKTIVDIEAAEGKVATPERLIRRLNVPFAALSAPVPRDYLKREKSRNEEIPDLRDIEAPTIR